MITKILIPLASIFMAHGVLDQSELVRLNVRFKLEPKIHPLYRMGDGRNTIRFRGNLVHGRFTDVECIESAEQGAKLGAWWISNVINLAKVPGDTNSKQIEFQVHFCNIGCDDHHPMGYSFWQAK